MSLVHNSANQTQNLQTNPADWSALTPVSVEEGPKPRAVYLAVRRMIESGQASPGTKLPTTRDIASRLGFSRASAVEAYETLVAEGFAEARVGAGTFVAAQVPLAPGGAEAATPASELHFAPLPGALGVANPDARTMRTFRLLLSRRLARPEPSLFQYGDPRGGLALREAIAAYLRGARGVRCRADDVIVTAGSLQGLDLVARATVKPGDPVWIEDPCYPTARAALESVDADLVGAPVDQEGLNPDLAVALRPSARAVYVTPSHQFPLGVTMSMRRRLALLAWARREGAWIIEDDYDSEFRYAGPPLAALQGMDMSGGEESRVAYLGTFAKILFPGLRVGYAVLPPSLMRRVLDLRAHADRQPSSLIEGALTDLLTEGHFAAHIRRARRRAQAGRDALMEGLSAGDNRLSASALAPAQGLHLVAGLPPDADDVALAASARVNGVSARALSPMYLRAEPRQGLVLGFSGFSDETLRAAGRTIGSLLG
jgi:GntR family transcriptional regulator/MocR family aminotransferase